MFVYSKPHVHLQFCLYSPPCWSRALFPRQLLKINQRKVFFLFTDTWYTRSKISVKFVNTVNQLNLTAVKLSFLTTQTYLAQENWTFGKILFFLNNLNCLLRWSSIDLPGLHISMIWANAIICIIWAGI